MDYVSTIFPQYNISHEFLKPGLKLIIKSKKNEYSQRARNRRELASTLIDPFVRLK